MSEQDKWYYGWQRESTQGTPVDGELRILPLLVPQQPPPSRWRKLKASLGRLWSLIGTWWVFAAFTVATLVLLWLAIAAGPQ